MISVIRESLMHSITSLIKGAFASFAVAWAFPSNHIGTPHATTPIMRCAKVMDCGRGAFLAGQNDGCFDKIYSKKIISTELIDTIVE